MKRKTVALMTALLLVANLSACGDKASVLSDESDMTSIDETEEIEEETEEIKEETIPEEAEEDIAQKEMERVQSALGEIPYYGDISKCKMSAEQATAYAQLIADGLAGDFSFRGGYDENIDIMTWDDSFQVYGWSNIPDPYETDRKNVILADFARDGIPYLYLFSSQEETSFEIYGWADGEGKLAASVELAPKEEYYLYEDEDDESKVKLTYAGLGGAVHDFVVYSFYNGTTEEDSIWGAEYEIDGWHIFENEIEKSVYAEEEYQKLWEKTHTHTLPYTCLYDMEPCTLEEMVDYLNAYATVMSDGQSVPVEIVKTEIVRHEGTGLITKGEVPQWKIDNLEILRQYMSGEKYIGVADASIYVYTDNDYDIGRPEAFYFSITDLNNDGNQELLVSYKDEYGSDTDVFLPSSSKDALTYLSLQGIDKTNGTYIMFVGSVSTNAYLYIYDGTTFSEISSLSADDIGGEYNSGTITENGETRDLSEEEFYSIYNDWKSRHTDLGANIHLDIENIESAFQVKINTQNSGEWFITDGE